MYKKDKVRLLNGEEISYIKHGSGDQTLLLIHANYGSSLMYIDLLEKIDENFTIYAVDLRGYGDSTYHRRINGLEDLAEDMNFFIRQLKLSNIFLIGWGMGGGVAMQLAAKKKEIKKLVLISSTSYKGYPLYKKDKDGEISYGETFNSADELLNDEVDVKPVLNIINNRDVSKMEKYLQKYFYNNVDYKYLNLMAIEALKQRNLIDINFALASFNLGSMHNFYTAGNHDINNINIPVLHVIGSGDVITPKYMALDNYEPLKNNSEVIKVNYCGHSLFAVNNEIINSIINFINK